MLFMLGFGGTAFKKVYFCPLRNRPVSETVDADDLIVNNSATDLKNAKRVTHRVMMRPSTVKRLQILGVYKDMDLPVPKDPTLDAAQREERSVRMVAYGQAQRWLQATAVPIEGGGRLTGRVGSTTIGALQMLTNDFATLAGQSYSVGRMSREIGRRSRIGLIGVQRMARDNTDDFHRTFGVDGQM